MKIKTNFADVDKKILHELKKIEKTNRVILETAKNGEITAKVETDGRYLYLHSRYNPTEEAETIYKNKIFEKNNIFISGFGLGYHILEIVKNLREKQKIVVMVTDPEVFKYAVEFIKLENITKNKNVEILFSAEKNSLILQLQKKLEESDESDWDFVVHQPSIKTVPENFRILTDIIDRIEINKKSLELFKPIIMENVKNNVKNFVKDHSICEIENIYKKAPLFIVAAGPSLDKNIDYLKNIEDKGIIVSVGTTAKKLIKRGIIPDFIIVIDGLGNVYKQLEGIEERIPLIYFPTANYMAVDNYKGKRICAFPQDDPLFEEIEQVLKVGTIKSGGSVATAACDLAKKIGAETIIFVGQDLALSEEGLTHVSGTQFENNKKEQKNLKKVRGNISENVYTLKNLYVYLKWFEDYIETEKNIKFVNSTEGGAYINGTAVMSLSDAINKYCVNSIEKKVLTDILIRDFRENDDLIQEKILSIIENRKQ